MGCNSCNADSYIDMEARAQWENEVDYAFMNDVAEEVKVSCALPFALPIERLPKYIKQAAQYFWYNDDLACEERIYFIPNSEICKCKGNLNKILQLPEQIIGVHGVYKTKNLMRYGTMGDFSLERMMMSSYSQFGGVGTVGGGFGQNGNSMGYNLTDVVVGLYEIDTFNTTLVPTLSYVFNIYTHKLNIEGDLGNSGIIICVSKRVPIQCLYQNPYFFRYVVALVKRSLDTIYGALEFKLPGGVSINLSVFKDSADADIEEIKEWFERNRTADYFFVPNIL